MLATGDIDAFRAVSMGAITAIQLGDNNGVTPPSRLGDWGMSSAWFGLYTEKISTFFISPNASGLGTNTLLLPEYQKFGEPVPSSPVDNI